jgi:hypothetical protein
VEQPHGEDASQPRVVVAYQRQGSLDEQSWQIA